MWLALIYCLLAQFIDQVFVSGILEKVTSRVEVHQEQRMQRVLGNFCSAWRKYLQASGNECISVQKYAGSMLKARRNNLLYPPPPLNFSYWKKCSVKVMGST